MAIWRFTWVGLYGGVALVNAQGVDRGVVVGETDTPEWVLADATTDDGTQYWAVPQGSVSTQQVTDSIVPNKDPDYVVPNYLEPASPDTDYTDTDYADLDYADMDYADMVDAGQGSQSDGYADEDYMRDETAPSPGSLDATEYEDWPLPLDTDPGLRDDTAYPATRPPPWIPSQPTDLDTIEIIDTPDIIQNTPSGQNPPDPIYTPNDPYVRDQGTQPTYEAIANPNQSTPFEAILNDPDTGIVTDRVDIIDDVSPPIDGFDAGLRDGPVDSYVPEAPINEVPTTDPPIVEIPTTDPPIVEIPTTDPPMAETPIIDPPVVEVPTIDPPIVEMPIIDPPVVEVPTIDPPIVEMPIIDPPIVEMPIIDPPVVEMPTMTTTPMVDTPAVKPPVMEMPIVDTPIVDTPKPKPLVDAPVVNVPAPGTRVEDIPLVDDKVVDAPKEAQGQSGRLPVGDLRGDANVGTGGKRAMTATCLTWPRAVNCPSCADDWREDGCALACGRGDSPNWCPPCDTVVDDPDATWCPADCSQENRPKQPDCIDCRFDWQAEGCAQYCGKGSSPAWCPTCTMEPGAPWCPVNCDQDDRPGAPDCPHCKNDWRATGCWRQCGKGSSPDWCPTCEEEPDAPWCPINCDQDDRPGEPLCPDCATDITAVGCWRLCGKGSSPAACVTCTDDPAQPYCPVDCSQEDRPDEPDCVACASDPEAEGCWQQCVRSGAPSWCPSCSSGSPPSWCPMYCNVIDRPDDPECPDCANYPESEGCDLQCGLEGEPDWCRSCSIMSPPSRCPLNCSVEERKISECPTCATTWDALGCEWSCGDSNQPAWCDSHTCSDDPAPIWCPLNCNQVDRSTECIDCNTDWQAVGCDLTCDTASPAAWCPDCTEVPTPHWCPVDCEADPRPDPPACEACTDNAQAAGCQAQCDLPSPPSWCPTTTPPVDDPSSAFASTLSIPRTLLTIIFSTLLVTI